MPDADPNGVTVAFPCPYPPDKHRHAERHGRHLLTQAPRGGGRRVAGSPLPSRKNMLIRIMLATLALAIIWRSVEVAIESGRWQSLPFYLFGWAVYFVGGILANPIGWALLLAVGVVLFLQRIRT